MPERGKINARLSLAEQNFKDNKLNFQILDSIIIENNLRSKLFSDKDLEKRWTDIYSKCMDAFHAQSRNLSLSDFVSIPREEFAFIYERNSDKTPNYNRFVEHVNSFSLSVQLDILESESIELGLAAFHRWIEHALQAFSQNDFTTAISIYSGLNTSATMRFQKCLNPRGKQLLQKLDTIFDPLNQSQTLRDLMIGQSVPDLSVFAGIITKTRENSNEKDLKKHESFLMTEILLTDMQERCREITPPEYQNTSSELHLTKDSQEKRVKLLALNVLGSEPSGPLSTDETDKLLYDISHARFKFPKSQDFAESTHYFEIFFKKLGFNVPESQKQYEQAIHDLRKYAQAMPKNGIVSERRQAMLNFLHQLGLRSNIRKKIEWIQQLLSTNTALMSSSSSEEKQRLTLNPAAIPLLNKLISALETRDKEEMQRLGVFKANQHLTADRIRNSKTQKEAQGVQFIIPYCIVYEKPTEQQPVPPLRLNNRRTSKTYTSAALSKLLDAKPSESANTISQAEEKSSASTDSSPNHSRQSSPHSPKTNSYIVPKGQKSPTSSLRNRVVSRSSSPITGHPVSYSPVEPGTPLYSPKSESPNDFDDAIMITDSGEYSDVSNGSSPQGSPHRIEELFHRPKRPSNLSTTPMPAPSRSSPELTRPEPEKPLLRESSSDGKIVAPISKRTSALLTMSSFSSSSDLRRIIEEEDRNGALPNPHCN